MTPNDTPFVSDDTLVSGASTATTGVKASYTVPAGVQAFLTSATMLGTTGTTQVCNLQLVRAATTYNLGQFTGNGIWTGRTPLQAGDVVQWNCTTAIAASVTDFTINIERERVPIQMTVVFGDQPAVLNQGINIFPGSLPYQMLDDHFGQAIREGIRAIATPSALTVGIVDIFHG